MANLERKTSSVDALVEDFTKKMDRQWVLDMLRDRHGLSLHHVQGQGPEEVRKRQRAYEAELAVLKTKWAKEDEYELSRKTAQTKPSV